MNDILDRLQLDPEVEAFLRGTQPKHKECKPEPLAFAPVLYNPWWDVAFIGAAFAGCIVWSFILYVAVETL